MQSDYGLRTVCGYQPVARRCCVTMANSAWTPSPIRRQRGEGGSADENPWDEGEPNSLHLGAWAGAGEAERALAGIQFSQSAVLGGFVAVDTKIRTADQRLRVFVSSTLRELAAERAATRTAIERLQLRPVMLEARALTRCLSTPTGQS